MSLTNIFKTFLNNFQTNPKLQQINRDKLYYEKRMRKHKALIKSGFMLSKSQDWEIRQQAQWIIQFNFSIYEECRLKKQAAHQERKDEEMRLKMERKRLKSVRRNLETREREEKEKEKEKEKERERPYTKIKRDEVPSAPSMSESQSHQNTQNIQNTHNTFASCAICFNALHTRSCTTSRCYHTFHEDCFAELIKTHDRCPLCRVHL